MLAPEQLSELAPTAFATAPPPGSFWQQFNIGLIRKQGDATASAGALFQTISPQLARWYHEGPLQAWFFMRKPPDVRLRVCFRPEASEAAPALERPLLELSERGLIRGHYQTRYLPEQGRFGGGEAMSLAHAYFHIDSWLWLQLEDLRRRGVRKLGPKLMLSAVLQHLFQQCCGEENSAVGWAELAALITGIDATPVPASVQQVCPIERLIRDVQLDPVERMILEVFARSNRLLRLRISAMSRPAEREVTPSHFAALVALFNLNRHGAAPEIFGHIAPGTDAGPNKGVQPEN